ncbi:Tim17/Tim22/Tim23/Pmp24 family [Babesia microti strain RI]|uniref:Tim17/Tim22/Tim23/Pmp24 family n=1 Tax=Babesia microti (strain RI) TaxID=1133968 RepID=A0A1R4AB82_BABMR|nr:Tim17/Tim22/Tim23/Pmp24 family [Babesia microti strain RI]SJK86273.1 Tim17/Tim22/Tim23/Pmp24 family [Babesia microti strain RI]|eukprot:XP_012648762.2 Tim17/Tim22/Tim23/Pmp24 family [Babesia microti strain RI]
MEGRDLSREPCPDRIVEDMGGAFGMGSFGGFIWHFIRGCRNSPRGIMLQNGLYSARTKAPLLGGNFAVWGGTFSSFDCTFQYIRRKEDHWNAIFSGFSTGGVLALRKGLKSSAKSALVGGLLLSIIEGVSIVVNRKMTPTPRQQYQRQMEFEKSMQSQNRSVQVGAA